MSTETRSITTTTGWYSSTLTTSSNGWTMKAKAMMSSKVVKEVGTKYETSFTGNQYSTPQYAYPEDVLGNKWIQEWASSNEHI